MKWWGNPKYVKYTPLVSRVGFEAANVAMILRMVEHHTSDGQSIIAYILLTIALLLWVNFYRVITPEQTIARVMSVIAASTNFIVLCVVIFYRFHAH